MANTDTVTRRLKIIADCYIPFLDGVLDTYADVRWLAPDEITPEAVRDADALLVRTRTRIDRKLLENSKCRFVATATIGMDHFNIDDCNDLGVTAVNAPGCNAPAVAQYVFASLAQLINRPIGQYTIGIVGVGHVGSIVERWAHALDMRVMRVDPPRQRNGEPGEWYTLNDVAAQADIITFHTPLTRTGDDATWHLGDTKFFDRLKRAPIIINSSRGPVVDNVAWLEAIRTGKTGPSVVDVWEGEPTINQELMNAAAIATPHIAGYSMDGKIRATAMVLDSLSKYFGLPKLLSDARQPAEIAGRVTISNVMKSYDPTEDTVMLRNAPDKFEQLRDSYALRKETPGCKID